MPRKHLMFGNNHYGDLSSSNSDSFEQVHSPVTCSLNDSFIEFAINPGNIIDDEIMFDDFFLIPPPDLPTQVPPLTPGTNLKMTQALASSFISFEKERERLNIPRGKSYDDQSVIDPNFLIFLFLISPKTEDIQKWSESDVRNWLNWAIREFSLVGLDPAKFCMTGQEVWTLGKKAFLARTPPFMGDILWEHLEIMHRGNVIHLSFTLFFIFLLFLSLSFWTCIIWFSVANSNSSSKLMNYVEDNYRKKKEKKKFSWSSCLLVMLKIWLWSEGKLLREEQ